MQCAHDWFCKRCCPITEKEFPALKLLIGLKEQAKGREIKSSMASGKNGKFAIVVCEYNVHMTGSARDVAL